MWLHERSNFTSFTSTIFPLSAAVYIMLTISIENRSLRGSTFDLVLAAFSSGLDLHQRAQLHHQAEGCETRTHPILNLPCLSYSLRVPVRVARKPIHTLLVGVIGIVKLSHLWLKAGSAAARLLGLRVRIPPGAKMCVSCLCCVLSSRGLCDEPITRPEESYRVWCVWEWSSSLDNEGGRLCRTVEPCWGKLCVYRCFSLSLSLSPSPYICIYMVFVLICTISKH